MYLLIQDSWLTINNTMLVQRLIPPSLHRAQYIMN
jgi:hypothetical protein